MPSPSWDTFFGSMSPFSARKAFYMSRRHGQKGGKGGTKGNSGLRKRGASIPGHVARGTTLHACTSGIQPKATVPASLLDGRWSGHIGAAGVIALELFPRELALPRTKKTRYCASCVIRGGLHEKGKR